MIDFQTALKNLIDQELNANSNGIEFNVNLYNSPKRRYFRIDKDTGQKIRFVPTLITDISGEYLPIPNANSTNNNMGIEFELFAGKTDTLSDEEIIEFSTVDYFKSLDSIENFKNNLLAKYFPLGNSQLYFGDEESKMEINVTSSFEMKNIYFKFKAKSDDAERLLGVDTDTYPRIDKTSSDIVFYISAGNTISVPYTVNQEFEVLCYLKEINGANYTWEITNGDVSDSIVTTTAPTNLNGKTITVGRDFGLEGYLKRLILDDTNLTVSSLDIDTLITTPSIEFKDFDDRYTITNLGELNGVTATATNCILWGDAGNAIFGFDTLIPESVFTTPEGNFYQKFFLNCNVLISNDVIPTNLFEYYLSIDDGATEERIYPVGRQHTYGTELTTTQKYGANTSKSAVSESIIDISNTFYYIPSKRINKIFKHITSGDIAQNTIYTLRVQFPFYNKTFSVVIDNGGSTPDVNSLATFTVSYKQKNDKL